MKATKSQRFIEESLVLGLEFGMVWLCAWLLNPNIDSGMVTLIGFMFGSLMMILYRIHQTQIGRF